MRKYEKKFKDRRGMVKMLHLVKSGHAGNGWSEDNEQGGSSNCYVALHHGSLARRHVSLVRRRWYTIKML
jgi:hypothetical protein